MPYFGKCLPGHPVQGFISNLFFSFFFMDFILEENAHGLALKFSQNHGNLENYKHGTVK